MTEFRRKEHLRTNTYGTTFRVRSHRVRREHWDIEALRAAYGSPLYRAADALRRSNVGRGAKGCFVIPNAKCPVCSVPVFYYSNAFGSRVYFDDLGPPWPKHPCTDNPRPSREVLHPAWAPITARRKGEIRELIDAANMAGLLRSKEFGIVASDEWTLLLVEQVKRSGELEEVRASCIDTLTPKSVSFSCFSEQPAFEPGDFVSIKGSEFSFFERRTMSSLTFRDGSRLGPNPVEGSVGAISKPVITAASSKNLGHKGPLSQFDPSRFHRRDMSREQTALIPRKVRTSREYRKSWAPKILQMIAEGARTPEQFAARLNDMGYRTANGGLWTQRLARLFVSYIIDTQKNWNISKKTSGTGEPATAEKPKIADGAFVYNEFCFGLTYEELQARSIKPINWLRRQGITNPNDIASQLNRAKLSPSKQIAWTGLSVQLLLELHDLGIRTNDQAAAVVLGEKDPKNTKAQLLPISTHPLATSAPLSKTEIARRLAIIGRVSIKED